MKFVDFFAGIGGIRLGLERAGHKCVGFCEWDKFARQSYKAMYDTEGEWENHDIRTASSYGIPKADLWTFGFPCFVAGTLVKTITGLKPIEEIVVGDMVYTHKLRYQPVVQTMEREADTIYHIKAYGTEGIATTSEHPFYVRQRKFVYKNRVRVRTFEEPKWVKTAELNKDYYLGIPVEMDEKLLIWNGIKYERKGKEYILNNLPIDKPEFYWFIGRWLGDGWTVSTTRNDSSSAREKVVLCCAKDELEEVKSKIDKLFNYTVSEEKTVYKLIFSNKELFGFLRRYGHGAANKFIHQEILQLPVSLLEQVLNGYFSADGCKVKNKIKATTVSRKLAYGLAACVNKVYKKGCAIYKTERNKTYTIQGRVVNQKDTCQIVFSKDKNKQDKIFYEDGFIWCPIWEITQEAKTTLVYNIGVNTDESYTANAICCHNCQDLSVAGKRKGLQEGERSGLFYEIVRLLQGLRQEDRPKWLLAENVKGLFSAGGGFDFLRCIVELGQLGYNIQYQLLNSKDFGVPQNRERVFIIGHLGEGSGREVFPLRRADCENTGAGEEQRPIRLGNIYGEQFGSGYAGNVWDKNGIAPALMTMAGGNREPMIIDVIYNNREPMFTLTTKDKHGVAIIDEQNKCFRKDGNSSSPKHNNRVMFGSTRIRKLTPRECWRLQGFPDEYFDKAVAAGVSNSQLYKQSGNAVSVPVAEAIGRRLREIEVKE